MVFIYILSQLSAVGSARLTSPSNLANLYIGLFASAWVKEISLLPEYDRSTDERECIRLVEEILEAVELNDYQAQRSLSVQLIYAWVSILKCCAVWGIESILADSLQKFAEDQA